MSNALMMLISKHHHYPGGAREIPNLHKSEKCSFKFFESKTQLVFCIQFCICQISFPKNMMPFFTYILFSLSSRKSILHFYPILLCWCENGTFLSWPFIYIRVIISAVISIISARFRVHNMYGNDTLSQQIQFFDGYTVTLIIVK